MRVIIDSINKYNYDGFDIDFEPNFGYSGNLSGNSDRMHIFWMNYRKNSDRNRELDVY